MNIRWDTVEASVDFFSGVRHNLTEHMARLGRQSEWTRLLALPVGATGFILGVAKAISHIGEAIFKGLANLFAWPFSSEFEFKRAFIFMAGETVFGLALAIGAIGEGVIFSLATALNVF